MVSHAPSVLAQVKDLNTVVLASPLATPRLPERRPSYSPERRPLTRMSSDGTLPSPAKCSRGGGSPVQLAGAAQALVLVGMVRVLFRVVHEVS